MPKQRVPTDIALGRQAEAARRAQAEEERWAQAAVRNTLSKGLLEPCECPPLCLRKRVPTVCRSIGQFENQIDTLRAH